MGDSDKNQPEKSIKITNSTPKVYKGTEGLTIGKNNQIIYDDAWLHPEISDEKYDKSMSRYVNSMYRTRKE